MLGQQGGKCLGGHGGLVTNKEDVVGALMLAVVDHDHVTGKVRGLLCRQCNSALGFAGDNPERLERLARYLRTA